MQNKRIKAAMAMMIYPNGRLKRPTGLTSIDSPNQTEKQAFPFRYQRLFNVYFLKLIIALCSVIPVVGKTATPSEAPTTVSTDRLVNAEHEPHNWLNHGRTYYAQRFSPLNQINDQNVKQLGLAWSFEFLDNRGLEATPIVVDDILYTTAAWSHVYAVNAKTGKLLWHYDPQVPKGLASRGCCGPVNRGVAVWQDKVYVGTYDGYLVALDRTTGEVVWRVLTIDPTLDYTITGAPRIVNGNVLIGNGGAEFGVRGYVSAYDATSGEMRWRFFTVPGNPAAGFENDAMALAAKTWNGQWWKLGGGGTVWDSMSFDPELNILYIGVGNGTPWDQTLRSPDGGDNLFLSSIVALNPDTGEYLWHYQTTPGESWDYTATQNMILADIQWQGKMRKVLMQAPKNGFFFVIDRVTGEFLSAEPFTNVKWASHYDANGRPVENPRARYSDEGTFLFPSALGAHNWHPMSYNPITGLVYIPAIKAAIKYKKLANYDPKPHHPNIGVDLSGPNLLSPSFMQILKDKLFRGELIAWDPIKKSVAWKVKHTKSWNGGTLTTAGNLVLQGTADHKFKAFHAGTGETLWEYNIHLGVVAPPISYSIDGEQYVALMAKWGGALPLLLGVKPIPGLDKGRLLVFKLNGADSLPVPSMTSTKMPPPPSMPTLDKTAIANGELSYNNYCATCHGIHVVSGGNVPDLRYMEAGRHQAFKAIVLDGILESNGMVGFNDVLNDRQAEEIYAYILQQAHQEFDEQNTSGIATGVKLKIYDIIATAISWVIERL